MTDTNPTTTDSDVYPGDEAFLARVVATCHDQLACAGDQSHHTVVDLESAMLDALNAHQVSVVVEPSTLTAEGRWLNVSLHWEGLYDGWSITVPFTGDLATDRFAALAIALNVPLLQDPAPPVPKLVYEPLTVAERTPTLAESALNGHLAKGWDDIDEQQLAHEALIERIELLPPSMVARVETFRAGKPWPMTRPQLEGLDRVVATAEAELAARSAS